MAAFGLLATLVAARSRGANTLAKLFGALGIDLAVLVLEPLEQEWRQERSGVLVRRNGVTVGVLGTSHFVPEPLEELGRLERAELLAQGHQALAIGSRGTALLAGTVARATELAAHELDLLRVELAIRPLQLGDHLRREWRVFAVRQRFQVGVELVRIVRAELFTQFLHPFGSHPRAGAALAAATACPASATACTLRLRTFALGIGCAERAGEVQRETQRARLALIEGDRAIIDTRQLASRITFDPVGESSLDFGRDGRQARRHIVRAVGEVFDLEAAVLHEWQFVIERELPITLGLAQQVGVAPADGGDERGFAAGEVEHRNVETLGDG